MKKYMTSLGVRKWSLVTFLFILFTHVGNSLRPYQFTYHGKGDYRDGEGNMHLEADSKGEVGMELYPTGSNLPDCSHACGPCFPCKRVMVSFKCAVESCPVVYRCMCKGKYYHVPSN